MLRIGLTGGIGSGKSVVTDMFRKRGVTIIDADVIAHQLVAPGSLLLDKIIEHFGKEYLKADATLDRNKLAGFIFAHPAEKKALEALLHPAVRDSIQQQLEAHLDETYVMVVIPLLIETGYTDLVDRILVVDCEEEQQIHRVLARDDRDQQQVQDIMQQQVSRTQRLRQADDVLTNNSDLASLQRQVDKLHHYYLSVQ